MARQASIAKMGFYPADPIAVDGILSHLTLPAATKGKGINIIDPCCGEGLAIKQIADGLGVPYEQTYCVELDANRGAKAKENMPDVNIVTPASFLGMKITGYSFGLAYVNPPFDNELGGGRREEQAFVQEAHRLLVPGGVLVLVCPLTALNGNRNFCEYIDARYEDVRIWTFPESVRKYNEIVLIARKRKVMLSEELTYQLGTLHQMSFQWKTQVGWERLLSRVNETTYTKFIDGRRNGTEQSPPYVVQPGWKPHQFFKSQYLPEELAAALDKSPLNQLLLEVPARELRRPPLPPGKGHVALLLASGMLNGVVEDDEGNHVVRGTAIKTEYHNEAASTSEEHPETGALKTVDVYSQRVVLVIRAAFQDGTILTLSDAPAKPEEIDDEEDTNEGREPWDGGTKESFKDKVRGFLVESGVEFVENVSVNKAPWE